MSISNVIFIIFMALWLLLLGTYLIYKHSNPFVEKIGKCLLPLIGSFFIIDGFFFQPWIEFKFLDYISSIPELLLDVIPTQLVEKISEKFGASWVAKFIEVFESFTKLNGLKIQLIPTYDLGIRVVMIFPFLLAILGLMLTLLGVFLKIGSSLKMVFIMFSASCAMAFFALLLSLPRMDALGIQNEFRWMLLGTILGAQLGVGPWFTLIGLVLLTIGGLIWSIQESHKAITFDEIEEEWLL